MTGLKLAAAAWVVLSVIINHNDGQSSPALPTYRLPLSSQLLPATAALPGRLTLIMPEDPRANQTTITLRNRNHRANIQSNPLLLLPEMRKGGPRI